MSFSTRGSSSPSTQTVFPMAAPTMKYHRWGINPEIFKLLISTMQENDATRLRRRHEIPCYMHRSFGISGATSDLEETFVRSLRELLGLEKKGCRGFRAGCTKDEDVSGAGWFCVFVVHFRSVYISPCSIWHKTCKFKQFYGLNISGGGVDCMCRNYAQQLEISGRFFHRKRK